MTRLLAVLLAFALLSFDAAAQTAAAPRQQPKIVGSNSSPTAQSEQAPVKKSKTGICHAPGTTYYSRTTNFTPFATLDDCLKSGGRLPKR